MVKELGLSAYAAFLFAVAICCMFFPEKVQAIAIKTVNWGLPPGVEAANSYLRSANRFLHSNQFRIGLRFIGLLPFLYSLLVVWMLVKHLRGEY